MPVVSLHGSQFSDLLWAGDCTVGDEIFCMYPDWHWGASILLHKGYRSFQRIKQLGCGIDYPPQSSAVVKEKVQLYLYLHSGPL